jgi:putative transposase
LDTFLWASLYNSLILLIHGSGTIFAFLFIVMPRPSRKAVLGDGNCVVHLTIRAHDKKFLFHQEQVKEFIYAQLLKLKEEHRVKIYAYVIMSNHLHLVVRLKDTGLFSAFMRKAFGGVAVFINRLRGRSGRVFGERARTPVVQDRRHLLAVMRYIENNPVRAGVVEKAYRYGWSSYNHYAYGDEDELIDDSPEYLALSVNEVKRRELYRELVLTLEGRGMERVGRYTSWYFIGEGWWVRKMRRERGLLKSAAGPPG